MRRFLQQLTPFLFLVIVITMLVFGMVLFAYLLIFGVIFGTILYFLSWIRDKFVRKNAPKPRKKPENGRIIDSDDWREL